MDSSDRREIRHGSVRIGSLDVTPIVASRFRLDGGSMFGVVPRALWARESPPDELGRIRLATNSLLIRADGLLMLVEPGMGDKYSPARTEIYALEEIEISSALRGLGITPDEIDVVILTHLHLDHAGGATARIDGRLSAVFPEATYLVQEAELEAALKPHPLARGSYSRDDIVPLIESGRLETVTGSYEAAPGVVLELTGGHTPGHQLVRLSSGGEEAVYPGDLVPTSAHLKPNWLMSWDLEPRETFDRKTRLLEQAADGGVLMFWAHDPVLAAARVERTDRGFGIVQGSEVEAAV